MLKVAALVLLAVAAAGPAGAAGGYAVVVSKATYGDAGWKKVADTLKARHKGDLVLTDAKVGDCLPRLQELFPRYTCFVATPAEAGRQFVADVHRLTRKLDDDPYTDTIWGIVTGVDAAAAMEIAQQSKPLVVHKAAGATEIALGMCEEGVWYCELVEGKIVRKKKGRAPEETKGPGDSTQGMVEMLNQYQPDLFVTSGHASERDWMLGYRYRNGTFRSQAGQLTGVDTQGKRYPVASPNPKVYLPVGNCLMGHVDGTDAMALAWMKSASVRQMTGYTVPSWFGYAGWGCLDYFVEQPGRYTFAEAFFANQHALEHRLATYFPTLSTQEPAPGSIPAAQPPTEAAKRDGVPAGDGPGLLHDRDVVAFYGDPAWEARMAKGDLCWEQTLAVRGGVYTLEIKPRHGAKSFDPVNTNGSQRGGRPFVQFLPHRVSKVQITEGQELNPVVADDFILVPNPGKCDPARVYRVRFRAERQ